ncbi:hypothetical protein HUJ05_007050 [Dendroctonus ponderosae]|nr:hypothetical protein HUJ05_007050 [Dendroctonus ponderosae]
MDFKSIHIPSEICSSLKVSGSKAMRASPKYPTWSSTLEVSRWRFRYVNTCKARADFLSGRPVLGPNADVLLQFGDAVRQHIGRDPPFFFNAGCFFQQPPFLPATTRIARSAAPAQEVFQFMLQPLFTLIELLNEQRQIGLQPDQGFAHLGQGAYLHAVLAHLLLLRGNHLAVDAAKVLGHFGRGGRFLHHFEERLEVEVARQLVQGGDTLGQSDVALANRAGHRFDFVVEGNGRIRLLEPQVFCSHVSFEAVEAECVLARQHSGIGEPLQANAALQQFFQCGKRVAFVSSKSPDFSVLDQIVSINMLDGTWENGATTATLVGGTPQGGSGNIGATSWLGQETARATSGQQHRISIGGYSVGETTGGVATGDGLLLI